jgi:hypothetical protein
MWDRIAGAPRAGRWLAVFFIAFAVTCEAGAAGTSPAMAALPGGVSPEVPLAATEGARTASGEPGQTVYDGTLDVTWLADANLASTKTFGVHGINQDGSMDYQTAVKWVSAMNAHNYLGHRTWQLPTTPAKGKGCTNTGPHGNHFGYLCSTSAMGSLYYTTLGLHERNTAVPIPDTLSGGFSDFQPYLYWTGTAAAKAGYRTFSFNTGWAGTNVPLHTMYVLPMIPGNPFNTPVSLPPRSLYASADGKTVYDPSAGVTWLADADLAKTEKFGVAGINRDGSMEHHAAVSWIEAMNKADWLGEKDWQLPMSGSCGGFGCETGPLGELYYHGLDLGHGRPAAATPDTTLGDFQDIQPYLYWSCAAQRVKSPCKGLPAPGFGWSFSFGNGFQGTDVMKNELYATAYYPGGRPTKPPPPPCKPQQPGKPVTCT